MKKYNKYTMAPIVYATNKKKCSYLYKLEETKVQQHLKKVQLVLTTLHPLQ